MSYASSAIKRLSNEYRRLQNPENRVREYYVAPLPENIFEWHFTLRGPGGDDNSLPYKDGVYHGALMFSRSYPLEPPDIIFFTRSGRFAVHEKICSTISSYHKELWQPTYDVALTLTALRHFMAQEDEFGVGAFPKNMVPLATKVAWAADTWSFKCEKCGAATKDVWETHMKMHPEISPEKEAQVPKLPPALGETTASGSAKPEDSERPHDALDATPSSAPASGDATEVVAEAADAARSQSKATNDRRSSAVTTSLMLVPPTSPPPGALGTPHSVADAFGAAHSAGTSTPGTAPRTSPHTAPPSAEVTASRDACSSFIPPDHHNTAHASRPPAHRETEKNEAINERETAPAFLTNVNATNTMRSPPMTLSSPPDTELGHRQDTGHDDPLSLGAPRYEAMLGTTSLEKTRQPAPSPTPGNDAVEAPGTEMLDSLSTPETNPAPPPPPQQQLQQLQPTQHVVFSLLILHVSIPIHLIDRSIIVSLLLVVLILLRRGICGLLMN
ncbi:hypothetical protein JKF63_07420 [Porcisia hertigi]|uniref:UBC core domain-containing protein n=1 Tax=Porcisia hertigi TaxID=2761500 RepID=A0A836YGR5_9TRYP|nr:hypothetical protein JKF63_07420 [Porcisia hertigi]